MLHNQFICSVIFLVLANGIAAEYNVDDVCSLVSTGTHIGSIESCQRYYTCNRGKAIAHECPAGTKFSKNYQTCLSAANVNCNFGDKTPCVGKTNVFVPQAGSRVGWIYCKNGLEAFTGTCANKYIFKDGECKYDDGTSTATSLEITFTTICQVLPNNKYFGSTKECGKWQICSNDKLTQGSCKAGLVYDTELEKCNYEGTKTCDRISGLTIQPDMETFGVCTTGDADKETSDCGRYLKCKNAQWTLQTCDRNNFFDTKDQKCVQRRAAKTKNCNRCQFAKQQFVNAVDPQCRKYLICENGFVKGSNSCSEQYYFDEDAQACVGVGGLSVYKAINGACAGELPPEQPKKAEQSQQPVQPPILGQK